MTEAPALRLPDPELVVVDFFLTVAEVTGIVGDRVYTEMPEGVVFPALRARGIPGGDIREPNALWISRMQVDGWADGKWEASRLIRRAHHALLTVRNWEHVNSDGDRCFLQGSRNVVAPGPSPDPDTNKSRFLFDCHVLLRPAPPEVP